MYIRANGRRQVPREHKLLSLTVRFYTLLKIYYVYLYTDTGVQCRQLQYSFSLFSFSLFRKKKKNFSRVHNETSVNMFRISFSFTLYELSTLRTIIRTHLARSQNRWKQEDITFDVNENVTTMFPFAFLLSIFNIRYQFKVLILRDW